MSKEINNPKVAVIMVNYKAVHHTLECIESIINSNYKQIEIIVVDNHSEDGCKKIMSENFPEVIVIEASDNLGFAVANNLGIRKAVSINCDFVMLLNNDTVLEADCIERLIDCYNQNKEKRIGIVTGQILNYYDRDLIWYAGGTLNDFKGDASINGFGKRRNEYKVSKGECTFASGCCMLMPIQVAENVNMSEDYFLYYEDVDFCKRMCKEKYEILYEEKAIIYHKESVSTDKKSDLYAFYFARNRLLYIKKNIKGMHNMIAKIYTMLWLMKKIIKKELRLDPVKCGIKEYQKGHTGHYQ